MGARPRPNAEGVSSSATCTATISAWSAFATSIAQASAWAEPVEPSSPTRIFFGSTIDGASSSNGERYADSETAFAFRKALRADCTCNGRDPAGLAPVDLALDNSLRTGDVIATTSGLVAYSGVKLGVNQAPEFTPVASYPGLTAEVRARLGEMKVAPVAAEMIANDAPPPDVARPATSVPKTASPRAKRAEVN